MGRLTLDEHFSYMGDTMTNHRKAWSQRTIESLEHRQMLSASPTSPDTIPSPLAAEKAEDGRDTLVARDDVYQVGLNATLAVSTKQGLLANDLNPGFETLRASLVEPTDAIELAEDGSFVFRSTELGSFSFQYLATDSQGEMSEATLTINVVAEDTRPLDLVKFAQELDNAGVVLYGWSESPFVAEQLALFEDGANDLNYVEAYHPLGVPNDEGLENEIDVVPTWTMPDGTRLTGLQSLEAIATAAQINLDHMRGSRPHLREIETQTVQLNSPLHIPLDAYDPDGDAMRFEVTISNPNVVDTQLIDGSRSLQIETDRFGEMMIYLFEERNPETTGRIIELAESGFYDGLEFHRVIEDFVIQAGDPTGTGTGGSTLPDVEDEYHPDLLYNRDGVFGFAKSNDDTNNSQFFITDEAFPHLDFQHSIMGQLIEGWRAFENISMTPTAALDRPTTPVIMTSLSVVHDHENGLLMLDPEQAGESLVRVVAIDAEGHRTSTEFLVNVVPDEDNSPPYLEDLPEELTIPNDAVTTLQLNVTDVDGDDTPPLFKVFADNGISVTIDQETGLATIVPDPSFTGDVEVNFLVEADGQFRRVTDTETVILHVVATSPEAGSDLNGDGALDGEDVDLLCRTIRSGSHPSSLDFDGDDQVNFQDMHRFLNAGFGSGLGDVNLDGRFDSTDLVMAFERGLYETGSQTAAHVDGDWNCDGEFNSRDLVDAMFYGHYQS